MSRRKYNTFLFFEHELCSPALESRYQMYNRMCMINTGTLTCLSYNTNDSEETKYDQYGCTEITLNADIRARMTRGGSGSDPTKLGRLTWACIGS